MLFNNSVTSVIILLFCQNGVTFSDSVKISSVKKYDEANVFVPTNEWQEIKRDQVIPKGLHVQIDLTTGMRRAKLLDSTDDDNQASQLVLSKNNDIENSNENLNKPFKEKYTLNLDKIGAIDPDTLSEIKNKYRSYTEIKEDFKNLELAVKTEMEVLNDLLKKFKDIKNNKHKSFYNEINWDDKWLNTLIDMEYLVHQVDNARMFTQANGIENIVFPSLNSSSAEVRAQACRLLGAASQNNVPSKIAALESGAIRVLLHTFLSDQSPSVQSSALYGLSSIIRNFPLAQKLLIDNGGIEVLNSVFDGENSDHLKLQIKILTLIDDLISERQEVNKEVKLISSRNSSNSLQKMEEIEEKQRQYDATNLEGKLMELDWCHHLINILQKQVVVQDLNNVYVDNKHYIKQLNHDDIEKIINSITSLFNHCLSNFKNNLLFKEIISNLESWYMVLSEEEVAHGDSDLYFTSLFKKIRHIAISLA